MEVRANKGKGPLLFEWHPEQKTIDLIRKDKFYRIRLEELSNHGRTFQVRGSSHEN